MDVEVVEAVLGHPAAGRELGQDRLVEPEAVHEAEAVEHPGRRDHPLELGEDTLLRHPRRPRGLLAGGRHRARVRLEVELAGEAREAQDAQRVVGERARRDHPEASPGDVPRAVVGVDEPAADQRLRDRVDREVTEGDVRLDRTAAQRQEVHVPVAARRDDAPPAERVRERERGPADPDREVARGGADVPVEDEVHVVDRALHEPVADRPADHPRARVAEVLPGGLERGAHPPTSVRVTRAVRPQVTS